jgi:hypothetical protein
MIGYTGFGNFVSGVTSSQTWLNILAEIALYGGGMNTPPIYLTTAPLTVVPGQIYLIGSGVGTPFSPGTAVIYLTSLLTSGVTFDPPVGSTVGAFIKVAGDWSQEEIKDGGFIYTSITGLVVPDDFRGSFHFRSSSAATITPAAGKTPTGQTGLLLPFGAVYHVFQNNNIIFVG